MSRPRKFPKDTVRIQFDARLPIVEIARALASEGIVLRQNPETNDLFAVRDPIARPAANVVPHARGTSSVA